MPQPIDHNTNGSSTTTQQEKDNGERLKPWFYKRKQSKYGVRRVVKYNTHHWKEDENARYIIFLSKYIKLFKGNIAQKRRYHLNRMLSKSVGTRSAVQCRSHHQRMMLAYKSPQNILKNHSFLISEVEIKVLDSSVQTKNQEKVVIELVQVDFQKAIKLPRDENLKQERLQMIDVSTDDYPWQKNDSLLLDGDLFKDY